MEFKKVEAQLRKSFVFIDDAEGILRLRRCLVSAISKVIFLGVLPINKSGACIFTESA